MYYQYKYECNPWLIPNSHNAIEVVSHTINCNYLQYFCKTVTSRFLMGGEMVEWVVCVTNFRFNEILCTNSREDIVIHVI